jgi:hypothetical protein
MTNEHVDPRFPAEAIAANRDAPLLLPNQFYHPRDVLAASNVSDDEKRAILASWASDAFALEGAASLRLYPGTDNAVPYDDIIEALKALDSSHERSVGLDASSFRDGHKTNLHRPQMHRVGGFGKYGYRNADRRRQDMYSVQPLRRST